MLCDLIVLFFLFQPSQDIKKETNSASLLVIYLIAFIYPNIQQRMLLFENFLFFGYHLLSENEEKTNVCQLFCKK